MYKYTRLDHELSPLRFVYVDTECYIAPDINTHVPDAFGNKDVSYSTSKFAYWTGEEEGCVMGFLQHLEQRLCKIIIQQLHIDFSQHNVRSKCQTAFASKNKSRDHDHIIIEKYKRSVALPPIQYTIIIQA